MGRRVLQKFTEKQIQINTNIYFQIKQIQEQIKTNINTNQHKYKYSKIEEEPGTKLAEGAPPITDGGTMKGGGGRTPIHVLL